MKRYQWVWSVVLTAVLVIPFIFVIAKQDTEKKTSVTTQQTTESSQSSSLAKDKQKQQSPDTSKSKQQEKKPAIVWGIDTASKVDSAFLQCVKKHYGTPAVYGRYLETKEGISVGLSKEEAGLLHKQGAKIIPIFNHFIEATSYEKGQAEAKEAINYAQKLGIPKGVAIFADIEPSYPVDEAFIRGWVDRMLDSPFKPGIYGVFTPGKNLSKAYASAVSKDKKVSQSMVWSSNPDPGVTAQSKAPKYQPGAPKGIDVLIWQYGIDGKTCNIDTNLIKSEVLDSLW